jgi:hypothetical protein
MAMSGFPSLVQYRARVSTAFWERLIEFSSAWRLADYFVFICILSFGALQFFSVQRVADFQRDDVFYADSGRSLIEHGFYGINGHPEANQPPGLPLILGLMQLLGFGTHVSFLRVMVAFESFGFLVTYELLKGKTSRVVAASICVLLISSRVFFLMATQWVFPSFPYFFTSMAALFVAGKFEKSTNNLSRLAWGALLALLIVASLLFASAGMAFLVAILVSTGAMYFRIRQLAFSRMKLYLVVFLVAAAVQGFWMHRKPSGLEWPIAGYPQSYLSQLKVKSGNQPELGMATLSDLPGRVLRNAADDAVLLSQTLSRRWIDVAWMSVLVTGPIVLILLGWGESMWRTGGDIQDWYFAAYQAMYLLWPWKTETRFFLPVIPLACFYLWRGCKSVVALARDNPRLLGLVWYPVAVILAVSSWFWMHGSWFASHMSHAGLQDEASFVVWIVSAIVAVRMIWAESSWLQSSTRLLDWFTQPGYPGGLSPYRVSRHIVMALVLALIVFGLGAQLRLAHTNLDLNSRTNSIPPDVSAAQWVALHTEPTAVIMARHVPIVYHYAKRKLVWFPPSSNPNLLMAGIRSHKIDYAIVVSREESYYLPPEEDCAARLLDAYPGDLQLVQQGAGFKIFRVLWNHSPSPQGAAPLVE